MKRIEKAVDLDQKTNKSPDFKQDFFFDFSFLIYKSDLGFFNKINGKVKYLQ
jgi:hypothetical protein